MADVKMFSNSFRAQILKIIDLPFVARLPENQGLQPPASGEPAKTEKKDS